ncbi:MAG: hypothetical protein K9G58_00925 [Bacteroidales bacterium]|nr:hypothetical protein [Bacteroidales bacterium]MCF8396698.1 hypothetical protein [Bacteroidales bacterium]
MKHLRLNARQYNYTTESFINFYVVSICRKITPHEFENPSLEVQEKLHDILEFCDRKFLYESMMEGR